MEAIAAGGTVPEPAPFLPPRRHGRAGDDDEALGAEDVAGRRSRLRRAGARAGPRAAGIRDAGRTLGDDAGASLASGDRASDAGAAERQLPPARPRSRARWRPVPGRRAGRHAGQGGFRGAEPGRGGFSAPGVPARASSGRAVEGAERSGFAGRPPRGDAPDSGFRPRGRGAERGGFGPRPSRGAAPEGGFRPRGRGADRGGFGLGLHAELPRGRLPAAWPWR